MNRMKRKYVLTMCLLLFAFASVMAQTDLSQHRHWDDAYIEEQRQIYRDSLMRDSLSLAGQAANQLCMPWNSPMANIGGYGIGAYDYPYAIGNDFGWRLHEGFNAQFGMSVSAGWGKHAPKGVGFGQTAAFAYVHPITNKLSIAAGIMATNFKWGAWQRTDVGIGGVLAYKVNDNINLYLYGQKTFLPRSNDLFGRFHCEPFPFFYDQPNSRIGAAAEFKVGKNAMIGVSVERRGY